MFPVEMRLEFRINLFESRMSGELTGNRKNLPANRTPPRHRIAVNSAEHDKFGHRGMMSPLLVLMLINFAQYCEFHNGMVAQQLFAAQRDEEVPSSSRR